MTDDKPTDYAALIRAANAATPDLPDWLKASKRIHSPRYGIGEIISWPPDCEVSRDFDSSAVQRMVIVSAIG